MYKKLDAIIFGATGYTGQVVVKDAVELLREYECSIAGRSKQKLRNLLADLGKELGRDLSYIPVVTADVSNQASIKKLVKNCKIVLNCCGPYQLYGEVVVKACVEAATYHVDISGEPLYIDGMQLKYHDWAKEILKVPHFESSSESQEISSKAILNIGTWESAVYAARKFPKLLSLQTIMNDHIKCRKVRPALHLKSYIQSPNFSKSYIIPFPSVDRTVVERSQRRLYEFEQKRPIQFETYIGFRSLFMVIFIPIYAVFLMLLALIPCTYKLLIKYAELFTFGRFTYEGPTVTNREAQHFSMVFKAKGWSKHRSLTKKPDREQLTRVSGINPFYGFTSIALILAAKTILKESKSMPGVGWVLPPGAAFYKTNLIEELSTHKYGLKFEVVK